MAKLETVPRAVSGLLLDLSNPRMPDSAFADQDQALAYLVKHASLDELVQSIATSGWIDFEPLIVLKATSEVIEGNRRLAALRLIEDPGLAARLGVRVPETLHSEARPAEVRAWVVDDRREARDFIGFKHINGPFKWDSFAKAKYAFDWLRDDPDSTVADIALRLGDTHRTVERLVNGYKVLAQAEALGFDRELLPGRFSFSHLYTAITRPAYRDWLGLPATTELLDDRPVPADHIDNLMDVLGWLYGTPSKPPVVRSQNPDLKRLAEVLPNRIAVQTLRETQSLSDAYTVVENKAQLFEASVVALSSASTRVASLQGHFDGDEQLLDVMATVQRTVRGVIAAMKESLEGETGDPAGSGT